MAATKLAMWQLRVSFYTHLQKESDAERFRCDMFFNVCGNVLSRPAESKGRVR